MSANLENPSHAHSTHEVRWTAPAVCLALSGILLFFFGLRIPLAMTNNGEVDEDWFIVPGWTVLHEGIPRIPYAPYDDPIGMFYRGDEILFGMPPAFFYWEAIFFAVLPDGYATGRIASMVAGAVAILCTFWFGRLVFRDDRIAVLGAGLYSLARIFYFPASIVRPDMLCAMFGALSVCFLVKWSSSGLRRWLFAAGATCGLGLLTHPFALVYCLPAGIWVLAQRSESATRRIADAVILTSIALLFFAPWLLLIVQDPDLFVIQFRNNILSRPQAGLSQRFFMFWKPLWYHIEFVNYRTMIPQLVVMIAGLIGSTLIVLLGRGQGRANLYFGWFAIYLLVCLVGKHPTMGYWCYPAIFIFLGVAHVCIRAHDALVTVPFGRLVSLTGASALLLVMLLGSGVRAWWETVRNWSDPSYNSPLLVKEMLSDLPVDAHYLADRSYVFDFYIAGRHTTLALNDKEFFMAEELAYDYLIVNPMESKANLPSQLNGIFEKRYGEPDRNGADVYRSAVTLGGD